MSTFTLEALLALKKQIEEWPIVPETIAFLPSAVVESRVGHLNHVQKLYTYVFKMGGSIASYKYVGNKIEVEVQVPFPKFPPGTGDAPVTVYVELEPQ